MKRQNYYISKVNQPYGFGFHVVDVASAGFSFRQPEPSFEKDCLAGRDLPILCDKCSHALIKLNKCELSKNTMTKIKFRQLQESDYCKDFEDIILENA